MGMSGEKEEEQGREHSFIPLLSKSEFNEHVLYTANLNLREDSDPDLPRCCLLSGHSHHLR